MEWCQGHGLTLHTIEPFHVAAYIETHPASAPTVKQHLSAIRMLFDYLVIKQIVPSNPTSVVRGPRHVVKKGKTPILVREDAAEFFQSFDTSTTVGLRDRALVGVMLYSFARVSAVVGMNVEDYYHIGRRSWLRLHEKGGKLHEVPAHHTAQEYLDAYIETAGIGNDGPSPLFRTAIGRTGRLSENRMYRQDALRMIKRRARDAGLSDRIGNHTFRGTGITVYLENGGQIEHAQSIAGHESPRTTKLYDRRNESIELDEIEKIVL